MVKATLAPDTADARALARRHLQFAWWSLLCFLSLGIFLEALHGLKIEWYLEPAFETRRLMWTLGHAHGTLLALVHAAFAMCVHMTLKNVQERNVANRLHRWASPCLIGSSVLLPGGFLLGGVFLYAGDPGLGIFLVPVGALLLLTGVLLTALVTITRPDTESESEQLPVKQTRHASKR
jgi:hypothetical protein